MYSQSKVIKTPIDYFKHLLRKELAGRVKDIENFLNLIHAEIKKCRYVPVLIDLYHDAITYDKHLPNIDGLLAFNFYRLTCSLVDKAVIPIPHIHVGEIPIFIHSDPIIRVERRNGETKYFIRCGYDICEFNPYEWKVYRSSKLDVDKLKIRVYLRKFYDDVVYSTLKSIKMFGLRTVVNVSQGILRQVFTNIDYYTFNLSYVAYIPKEFEGYVKKLLIGIPIGENTIIYDVKITELKNISDYLDLFYVPICDGSATNLYVLTKTIPKKVIDESKVLVPIETFTKPSYPYWKGKKKVVCYAQGTILIEKVKFW